MIYSLDTNAVIGVLARRPELVRRVRGFRPEDFGISAIAMQELFWGAFKSRRPGENLAVLEGLRIEVMPFDAGDARHAGDIRAALARAGIPIGPFDLLIAGQARARGLTLVTHNVGEFERVAGLHVEDWQD